MLDHLVGEWSRDEAESEAAGLQLNWEGLALFVSLSVCLHGINLLSLLLAIHLSL